MNVSILEFSLALVLRKFEICFVQLMKVPLKLKKNRIDILVKQYEFFKMDKDESIKQMFARLILLSMS